MYGKVKFFVFPAHYQHGEAVSPQLYQHGVAQVKPIYSELARRLQPEQCAAETKWQKFSLSNLKSNPLMELDFSWVGE
jgi:hypothetical protein